MALMAGCSSSLEMPAHIDSTDNSTMKSAIYIGDKDTEDVMHIIEVAAEKDGWIVTKFKRNAIIVEKAIDGETMSSTLKYQNGHISGDNDHASMDALLELRSAIVAEIKAEKNGSDH